MTILGDVLTTEQILSDVTGVIARASAEVTVSEFYEIILDGAAGGAAYRSRVLGVASGSPITVESDALAVGATASDIQIGSFSSAVGTPGGVEVRAGGTAFTAPASGVVQVISEAADIILDARGMTTPITLNEAGDLDLVGFTATSIVGALNELNTGAGPGTLDSILTQTTPDNDVTFAAANQVPVAFRNTFDNTDITFIVTKAPPLSQDGQAISVEKGTNCNGYGISVNTFNESADLGNAASSGQGAFIAVRSDSSAAVGIRGDQIQLWDNLGSKTVQLVGHASSSLGGIRTPDETVAGSNATSIRMDTGDGGDQTGGSGTGGTAGTLTISTGEGGAGFAAATPSPAAPGGTLNINSGAGGDGQSSGVSAAQRATSAIGGPIIVLAGDGGQPSAGNTHTADGATGGLVSVTGGAGGDGFSGITTVGQAGAGGAVSLIGGVAGLLTAGFGTANVGGAATVIGGVGSDGSVGGGGNAGDGGDVSVTAGAGGASTGGNTNVSGGALIVDAGAAGTGGTGGVAGDVSIGITNAVNINVGASGTLIGFYGVTAVAQSAAYARNATIVEDRTLLASASATATNNNNVLAALIADLQALGIIG